jgi:hypothetical protein
MTWKIQWAPLWLWPSKATMLLSSKKWDSFASPVAHYRKWVSSFALLKLMINLCWDFSGPSDEQCVCSELSPQKVFLLLWRVCLLFITLLAACHSSSHSVNPAALHDEVESHKQRSEESENSPASALMAWLMPSAQGKLGWPLVALPQASVRTRSWTVLEGNGISALNCSLFWRLQKPSFAFGVRALRPPPGVELRFTTACVTSGKLP